MSLATRCPACGTVFRVVRDQLKVSEGWVRCGRCSEVFNAGERLFELEQDSRPVASSAGVTAATAAEAAQAPAEPAAFVAAGAQAAEANLVEADSGDTSALTRPAHPRTPTEGQGRAAADKHASEHADVLAATPFNTEVSARSDVPAEIAADLEADRAAELAAGIEADSSAGSASAEAATPPDAQDADLDLRADPEALQTVPTPGFVLRAERAERWRHPLRRSTMAGLSLLLAATLAGQVAVHYRDGLAAAWPASRAWLRAVCDRIGCNIEAPMRIDSLAVESSGLVRVDGSDVYQLSLVVRNRAASEVRMPAVDLAMTDAQGQTTARRVLFAAELGQDATSLPAQGEATLQAMLSLGERRVAGYTVELFYP